MCASRRMIALSSFIRLLVPVLSFAFIGGILPVLVFGKPSCPAGQFRNATSVPARCSPCSSCPINHIVRKPCNRQNDTVCGPFYEFEFFNQRQSRTGQPYLADHRDQLGYRLTKNGLPNKQSDGDDSFAMPTTSNSPDEAITVRCGQPQWRVLCYGLVVALIVIVSLALSAFALFTFCRSSVKTTRLSEPSGVTRSTTDDDPSSESSTTIVVNRDVRHLEEQLMHNQRRKAFLRWLFGSAAADRLFSSNDYLDERHRSRFLLMLDGPSRSSEPHGEALALEPYPGMTLTGRSDHNNVTQPDSNENVVAVDDSRGGSRSDLRAACSSSDEVQADEQSAVIGEKCLLLPQELKRHPEDD